MRTATNKRSTTGKAATRRTTTTARSGFIRVHVSNQLKSWINDPEHRQQFDQWLMTLKPNQIASGRGQGRGRQTATRSTSGRGKTTATRRPAASAAA